MVVIVAPEGRDIDRYEPIALPFDYDWQGCGPCAEPCIFPCCCCYACCNFPLIPCIKSQKDKAVPVHNYIFKSYTADGVFGKDAIALSFRWSATETGFKAVEIFRNIDAAEAYYSHFTTNKSLMFYVLSNLPWRQKKGPTAVVGDGNVKAYVTIPEGDRLETIMAIGKQTEKYNKLKVPGKAKCSGPVEIEEWKSAPSMADLEKQFGRFHFGWDTEASWAPTDTDGSAPVQEEMKN